MSIAERRYDVVVVGAGNAALCAALSAREAGASVVVLERAPEYLRGGNSYFTGGLFRFAYDGPRQVRELVPEMSREEEASTDLGSYPQSAYYADVMRMTEGLSDADLVQALVSESYPTMSWMRRQGVRWVPAYGRQAFEQDGVRRFWGGLVLEAVGAGKGLVDSLFDLAERAGADVLYRTKAASLLSDDRGRVTGVAARTPGGVVDVTLFGDRALGRPGRPGA